jgi:hypothetical protein
MMRSPHVAAYETYQRSLEFSFFTRKRLFQHYRHNSEITARAPDVRFRKQSGRHLLLASISPFDPGCVKTLTFNLRVEIPFSDVKTNCTFQLCRDKEIEKAILRILGSSTFSHSLDPSRTSMPLGLPARSAFVTNPALPPVGALRHIIKHRVGRDGVF